MDAPADLLARTERLLASDRVTVPTRKVLQARLARRYGAPQLLSDAQMRTLRAASARLVPEPDLAELIDLAGALDAALVEGDGDGWRYAAVQPDRELHPLGLDALEAAAQRGFGMAFDRLGPADQDALLQAASDGQLDSGMPDLDAGRWFEELLTSLVELHFSHPLVQVRMGYDGMADARGFQAVGLAEVAQEARRGE